jgi:hypothetical protein
MIRVGDRARCYDGTIVTVYALQCSQCEMSVPHEDCGVFAHVGQRRWVNVEFLEKVGGES